MKKTLLVGNGLNLAEGAFSWNDLLDDLRPASLCVAVGDRDGEEVPQPLQFEIIGANEGFRTFKRGRDPYLALKGKIQEKFRDNPPKPGSLHKQVYQLGIDHVITTNYDYTLEAASPQWSGAEKRKWNSQQKYMLESTGTVDGISFFHAHGIYDVAPSICIGYEHYMGYVQHMRTLLSKGDSEGRASEEPLYITQLLKGEKKSSSELWPLLFFTSDIAVVGLGLSFSEIDLWWLLSYRASLFSVDPSYRAKSNSIIYFDVCQVERGEDRCSAVSRLKKSAKAIALAGLDVVYYPIACKEYPEGYFEALDLLERTEDWEDLR